MLCVSVVLILSFLWCSDHLVNVFLSSIINKTVVFFIQQVFISLLFPHPLVHADMHTQGSEDVTESVSHNFPFIKSDIVGALWGGLRKKYAANKR